MGNSDDDSDFAEYGTALEPIEDDDAARKRPIAVSEQIAVDEKGRRRFHGAFTGGFSAGYFNTVGSKEGWTPSTFKSSRSSRNNLKSQNVLDFMDDEDKGAFGIAPQVLRTTEDFADKSQSQSRKRPWSKQSDGPIPGVPVLDQIIQPVKETVGIKILIKMGWRPGKGVGPKVQRKAKKARLSSPETDKVDKPTILSEEVNQARIEGKVYGCSIPSEFLNRGKEGSENESSDEEFEASELLAPDDVSTLLCNPKENVFGLGYKGLDRNTLTPAGNPSDLFGTKLKFRVENKKMSISGEAFGVGAFEENDDDIYSREDMSQYDFALETTDERKQRKAREELEKRRLKPRDNCIEGFRICQGAGLKRKVYPPPSLPPNFKPFHTIKKSRFESKASSVSNDEQDFTAKGLGRHSLKISERQVLIEDDISKIPSRREETPSVQQSVEAEPEKQEETSKQVKRPTDTDDDIQRRIERLKKFTQVLQAYSSKQPEEINEKATFKPFIKNPEKQERYDKYLTLVQAGFAECLRDLQPAEMTEWERDREKMEFERASKLYKPMNSILSNRFVSAKSHDISHLEPEREAVKQNDPKDDPKVAAQMNMFGKLTHRVMEWHPDKLVCKRFNIPNPYPDSQFVGVKGDPSHFGRSVKASANVPSTESPSNNLPSLPPPQKKSLFDNLDFSKPPPGLLPPGTEQSADSTPNQMETDENPANEGLKMPVLEFQKQLTHETSEVDKKLNVDDSGDHIERPPIDLFKEIFADSSDEDDEADVVEKEKRGDKANDYPSSEKQDESTSETVNIKPLATNQPNPSQRRGVFDKIDLDKLRPPNHDTKNSSRHENSGDESEEDMYGPLPPVSASTGSSSKSASTLIHPSKSKAIFSTERHVFSNAHRIAQDEVSGSNEVVWVEKNAVQDRHHEKSKKHSSKKSKKKSSKKEKRKSHKKEKKHKKKSRKHSKSGGKGSDSQSSRDSDSGDSDASSDSSIILKESLNVKALQQKLKEMTKF